MDFRNLFQNHLQKNAETEEKSDLQNHAANNNRRFFYMVEDRFALKNGTQCVVVGNIHGTICVDDAIYILQTNSTTTVTIVKGMELYVNGAPQRVKTATDTSVSLLLDMKKEDILPYSIITSIRPLPKMDVNEAVENPMVAGLLYEMKKFGTKQEYFTYVIFFMAHGHYLMPAVMSQQPTSKGDGTATFEKDSSIRFPSLNTPNDPNVTVFPLFTDWTELYKWQGAPKNASGKIDTIIFSFQDIAALIKDSPMSDGFVLNPFSENRFWFDRKLVNNIVNSEGYQKEFGEGKETSNIEEVHVAKDTKVMLGIPAESDEVKRIREKLITYGQEHNEVQKIALLLQITGNGEKAYLIDAEIDPTVAKEHFQKIYELIHEDAVEVKEILFVPRGTVDSVDHVTEEKHADVYQR